MALKRLLDKLLDLQAYLLSRNKDTRSIIASGEEEDSGNDSLRQPDMDEEISSDFEDENQDIADGDDITDNPKSEDHDSDATDAKNSNQSDLTKAKWVLPNGRCNYEEHIGRVYQGICPFRDDTINKWTNKIRLSSGKLNSKVSLLQACNNLLAIKC